MYIIIIDFGDLIKLVGWRVSKIRGLRLEVKGLGLLTKISWSFNCKSQFLVAWAVLGDNGLKIPCRNFAGIAFYFCHSCWAF